MVLADHVAGHGPPLLLVHGGSGSHRHWDRVVGGLAERFHVHAPDLPGFGNSPAVPAGTDGAQYVAFAAASLGALVPPTGVHLVGFSFGGVVAAGVARAWGTRVSRLSLLGPGGFGRPTGRDLPTRSRRDTDGSDVALREVARHNLGAMMFADAAGIDEDTVDQQMWNLAHARFDSLLVSFSRSVLDDIAALACPVQVIWGAQDVLAHPTPEARAQQVRARRPDARLDLVPGAGHWVQYERPEAVVSLLLDFHAPA